MIRAAQGYSLKTCLMTLLSTPAKLFHTVALSLPARLVFAVYFGTYATANVIDTMTTFAEKPPKTSGAIKFAGTTAVATGLTIYKDARMARYFGTSKLAKVPMTTYSLFTMRDAMTIYASFNLPAMVASKLGNVAGANTKILGNLLADEVTRQKTAQFVLPAAAQFLTTPVHLLGLDFFNRQQRLSIGTRVARVARDLTLAIPIRMVRIVPAFGLGGIINTSSRRRFMGSM